jgi:hypothetical protein
MMIKRLAAGCVTAVIALLAFEQCVRASGWVTGRGRFEKIAGRPAMGYVQLYEWDLFLSPADNSIIGPCRRLGAPPGQPPTYDGYYRIDNLPAGVYSIYVNQPDFFASPKVAPNVQIVDGQETPLNIDLDVDYSTYFKNTAQQQWTEWRWTWYQTFSATGTSVRGVSWVMAGWGEYAGDWAEVSILEDNGNADVRNWKVLGSKTDNSIASDSDEWVRWFSGQIPITPGKKYAVRIWVNGGCAIYKRDKDGNSYPQGRAYDDAGSPKNYDLNVTVFVDRNNQMVTHTRLSYGPGTFISSLNDTQWGQTFAASGNGLAAVDLFAASGDTNFDLTWRIRQGGPAGPQIGPAKTTQGAYFASTTDLVGVSYNPNDVPLIPRQTYYIEVTDTMGFTPFVQEAGNSYSDGMAFRRGTATEYDLAMTIVEYADTQRAEPADLNGDGSVDFLDYALLANQWLQPPGTPSADIAPPPNGDQFVDLLDLAVFVEHWLKLPLPDPASNPNPFDEATNVSATPLLSWTPGAGAASHDVYFGTESPGTFQRNQTEATFSPGTLLTNKTYYWRIDEVNSNGKTTGTVWTFTTSGKIFCFPGDTLVWVNGAPMKISTVVSGQRIDIPSYLLSTTHFGQIERIEEHQGSFECYDIALETGNSISVADSHFFLTESGQWAPLQNLKPGSKLISSKGVISIRNIIKRTSLFVGKVYNLKIKDSDSYAIGEDGIIVRDY